MLDATSIPLKFKPHADGSRILNNFVEIPVHDDCVRCKECARTIGEHRDGFSPWAGGDARNPLACRLGMFTFFAIVFYIFFPGTGVGGNAIWQILFTLIGVTATDYWVACLQASSCFREWWFQPRKRNVILVILICFSLYLLWKWVYPSQHSSTHSNSSTAGDFSE